MSGMNWSLGEVASALSIAGMGAYTAEINRFVIDSRQVKAGDCFVALSGESSDGHDFLLAAKTAGAVAALVSHYQPEIDLPQILVKDVVLALQQLARVWRDSFSLAHVVAVTGSNGKTSVKEMLAAVFDRAYPQAVCATLGNLNNHLGVPLTLLSLRPFHRVAVIEIGANHVGEIASLVALVRPDVAVVTSLSEAHIGEFGSFEAIIKAKGEIFLGLEPQGWAVLPVTAWQDEQVLRHWCAALSGCQLGLFGKRIDFFEQSLALPWLALMSRQASEAGQALVFESSQFGRIACELSLLGEHQAINASAVWMVALACGLSVIDIGEATLKLALPSGRLKVSYPLPNLTFIDDSYNANPASMIAAIRVLAEQVVDHRVLVLGSMGELGETALPSHQRVASTASQSNVDCLLVSGEYSTEMLQAFAGEGYADEDPQQLARIIYAQYQSSKSMAVLVKGSRSSKMERVGEALRSLIQQKKLGEGSYVG